MQQNEQEALLSQEPPRDAGHSYIESLHLIIAQSSEYFFI